MLLQKQHENQCQRANNIEQIKCVPTFPIIFVETLTKSVRQQDRDYNILKHHAEMIFLGLNVMNFDLFRPGEHLVMCSHLFMLNRVGRGVYFPILTVRDKFINFLNRVILKGKKFQVGSQFPGINVFSFETMTLIEGQVSKIKTEKQIQTMCFSFL